MTKIIEETTSYDEITTFEVIKLMKELIYIPSPYFFEDNIMDFTYQWFINNQMKTFLHLYHESNITNFMGKNVICELTGQHDGPIICINCHLDTVNLCSGWSKDPYTGLLEDDKIYGLGALDMKSGCCASMLALRKFNGIYKEFNGKIIATFVSDEEGPYGLGTNALIEDGLLKDVDFIISTEPSAGFNNRSFPDVSLGARGGYGLEVEFFGKACHAALPTSGINAAVDASKFIYELEKIDYVEGLFLGKGVACVIAIEGDGGACSAPDYAKVRLFWHVVLGEDEEKIESYIISAIEKTNIKSTFKITFRDSPSDGNPGYLPYIVPQQNCFVATFLDSIKNVCSCDASISYFQCIGDFNHLSSSLNAPVIIFGAEGEHIHGPDEYATISSIKKTADIIYDFLVKVLTD